MRYALVVMGTPLGDESSARAAAFAHAVLDAGHSLERVFFYDEGVYNGLAGIVAPQDERDPLAGWLALAAQEVELVLCIGSAVRRGALDSNEAQRYEKTGATIHPAFTVGGLGLLVEASAQADRLLTFG